MKKTGILNLSVLILLAFSMSASANEKVLDVIHLNNGKKVTDIIVFNLLPNVLFLSTAPKIDTHFFFSVCG